MKLITKTIILLILFAVLSALRIKTANKSKHNSDSMDNLRSFEFEVDQFESKLNNK